MENRPKSVHPAANWQAIQRSRITRPARDGRLLSSSCTLHNKLFLYFYILIINSVIYNLVFVVYTDYICIRLTCVVCQPSNWFFFCGAKSYIEVLKVDLILPMLWVQACSLCWELLPIMRRLPRFLHSSRAAKNPNSAFVGWWPYVPSLIFTFFYLAISMQ